MFAELLAMVIGQSAAEALRDSKDSRASAPERDANALMGVVSAGLGGFGLLFGLLATLKGPLADPVPTEGFAGLAIIAAIGFACSCVGLYLGRKALRVTRRHPGIAKCGSAVSAAGLIVSVVSLAFIGFIW